MGVARFPLERFALLEQPAVVVVADGAGAVDEDAWGVPLERELFLDGAATRVMLAGAHASPLILAHVQAPQPCEWRTRLAERAP